MTDGAAEFIKYDFATTQDLCKQFITVVTAVLVFSITFSDKILDYAKAGRSVRVLLSVSWSLMLSAIAACGLGLTYICIAAGQAVYGFGSGYLATAQTSYGWIIGAGVAFISSMAALIILAVIQAFRCAP